MVSELDFSEFERGECDYSKFVEAIADSPGNVSDMLGWFDESLDDSHGTLDLHIHLMDVNTAFNASNYLKDYAKEENLELIDGDNQINSGDNEVGFYIVNNYEEVQDMDSPILSSVDEKGAHREFLMGASVRFEMDEGYMSAKCLKTDYENIDIYFPSREAAAEKMANNLSSYQELMDEAVNSSFENDYLDEL